MRIKYLNNDCEKISKSCDLEFGQELLPLTAENNLLHHNPILNERGFGLFTLKKEETFLALKKSISDHIVKQLSAHQDVSADFQPSLYHTFLVSDENHYNISTWALDYETIGNSFYAILDQVEELLHLKLKLKKITHMGQEGNFIGFRIIRPGKNDHNPFHRDAWIPYWRDTINIWLPICGFEDGNSLQLIPESHHWTDNQILKTKAGVEIDGKKYHVPAAIGTTNNFEIETPVLSKGDALIFSPYLIHGNGVNREKDTTRISLEFRFCKA